MSEETKTVSAVVLLRAADEARLREVLGALASKISGPVIAVKPIAWKATDPASHVAAAVQQLTLPDLDFLRTRVRDGHLHLWRETKTDLPTTLKECGLEPHPLQGT